jgi:CubicO group peptidase (beta-lactamase class C family)
MPMLAQTLFAVMCNAKAGKRKTWLSFIYQKDAMKKLILSVLVLATRLAEAQTLESQIDSISKQHFKDKFNVGLSIGVIDKGQKKEFYYGGKYSAHIKDVDSLTLFEIGSVTKLYTAFILASLENDNVLSRYDLLSKYLPYALHKGKKWSRKIRLVDLATHTSGLPAFDNTKSLKAFKEFDENNPYGMFTDEFLMHVLSNVDTLNNYGKVRYSNFGIGLLAYAMAKGSKTSFEKLFERYITNGQALKNTHLKISEQQLTDVAIPHRQEAKMPLIQLASLSPSGSIKATMPDLLQFLYLHINPTKESGKKIASLLENQLKDGEQAVGLGWGIHKVKNETVYFHNGGTYGSSSIVIIVPSKKAAAAILANNNTESELTSYALKLIETLITE